MNATIAVLAAGKAERFGRQKLLEKWRGRPLVEYALDAASDAAPDRVLLVTGRDSFAGLAKNYTVDVVHNPLFDHGIGTSIAAAARAVGEGSALMIVLGDQPLVTADHLRTLLAAWGGQEGGIVATSYGDAFGPPVLFGSAYLAELRSLADDAGARRIVRAHEEHVRTLRFEPAALDIDTPDDLACLD